jgi:pimeloyl-ACP methyl ester carboxylesterase
VLAAGRGPHRSVVDGLVLDSPALDWPSLLLRQAALVRLPSAFARLAMRLMQRGWVRGAVPGAKGTDLGALTAEELAGGLRVPVLIHASADDTYVPWGGSLRVAQLRPELVTLREAAGEHVKLWNVDPEAWERATEEFVRALPAPGSA